LALVPWRDRASGREVEAESEEAEDAAGDAGHVGTEFLVAHDEGWTPDELNHRSHAALCSSITRIS
jgi:hypothetical protein